MECKELNIILVEGCSGDACILRAINGKAVVMDNTVYNMFTKKQVQHDNGNNYRAALYDKKTKTWGVWRRGTAGALIRFTLPEFLTKDWKLPKRITRCN